jgi:polar amino acid transport system substrate-binding protein
MTDERISARNELAPSGRLRVAINRGNGVLVQVDPASGGATGVTVDLARALATSLAVPVELIDFDRAGKVFEALRKNRWDVAFLAIEPVRAKEIDFTPPYVIIEGNYVVPQTSHIASNAEIDSPGNRIAVIQGSAYDLFLTRTLKSASLVRVDSGEAAVDSLVGGGAAVGGVKQALLALMKRCAGLRIIEPPFMEIRQAMGIPKGRPAGLTYLKTFIEEMKASGFVAASLRRAGQLDVKIAPLEKE